MSEDKEEILGEAEDKAGMLVKMFRKRGSFSITRTILILAWITGLLMYVFGSLFAGVTVPYTGATIPAFDATAFLAVTGAASSLYFANHNISVGKNGDS